MSIFRKFLVHGLVIILVLFGVLGCGGSNNDQGTSFMATGYYYLFEDELKPIGWVNLLMHNDRPVYSVEGDAAAHSVWIGLFNRLSHQFLRVTRIDCSYDVQGAAPGFTIPMDSMSASFVIGPTEEDNNIGLNVDSSDGDNLVTPQVVFMPFFIVSTDIFQYLNVNRNSLPELPFLMTASCEAIGITQAGDVLVTNPVDLPILFTEQSFRNTNVSLSQSSLSNDGLQVESEFEEELDFDTQSFHTSGGMGASGNG